jgi:hypothetical protein
MLPDSFQTVNDHQRSSTIINISQHPSTVINTSRQRPSTVIRNPVDYCTIQTIIAFAIN